MKKLLYILLLITSLGYGQLQPNPILISASLGVEEVVEGPNIILNSGFTTSSSPWSGFGDQWAWSEGYATGTACTQLLSQTIGSAVGEIENGETYEITFTIALSVGKIRFRLGGNEMTIGTGYGGTGTFTHEMIAGSDGIFRVDDDGGAFTGTITGIELRKVGTTPDPPVASGDSPLLSNYRVEDTDNTKVLFDVSEVVTATAFTGFIIAGKTISAITIDGDGLGGAFTVTSAFNFFQRGRTIRYEGGSNIQDTDSNPVINFTLQHIKNNMAEPASTITRYVDVATGNDSDNGTTEALAWKTLSKAMSTATDGTTVWIKAGNYGNENIVLSDGGTVSAPIKFIGYKSTIGDITSNYYNYGTSTLDASEMPLWTGTSRSTGVFLKNDTSRDYVMIKNIQFTQYEYGMQWSTAGTYGSYFENVVGIKMGDPVAQSLAGMSIRGYDSTLKNCIVVNHTGVNMRITDDYNLVEDCESYCNETSGTDPISTDYYLTIRGGNNVILNITAHRDGDLQHLGHGPAVDYDSGTIPLSYNLFEGGIIKNIVQAIQISSPIYSEENVYRNILVTNDPNYPSSQSGGVMLYGSSNNRFEGVTFKDINEGIQFFDGASGNTFKNVIWDNCGFLFDMSTASTGITGNKFYNNVFSSTTNLFNTSNTFDSSNTFDNNIFIDITNKNASGGAISATFNNNHADNSFALSGTNNSSGTSNLDTNFKPTASSPIEIRENGTLIIGNEYDKDGIERITPYSKGITEY